MIDKDKKRLYRFLKEIGVFRQFVNYVDSNIEFHGYKNFASYCKNVMRYDIIRNAFLWVATPQGRSFWEKICNKWEADNLNVSEEFLKELESVRMDKNQK